MNIKILTIQGLITLFISDFVQNFQVGHPVVLSFNLVMVF